jgi:hypothetical protein
MIIDGTIGGKLNTRPAPYPETAMNSDRALQMMIGLVIGNVFNIDTQHCRCLKKRITCRAQILVMCATAPGANSGPRVR